MRVEHIREIATIIDNNTLQTLEQELPLIALEVRIHQNTSDVTKLSTQRLLFSLSQTFKRWEASDANDLACDTPTLIKMAYWLSTQTTWENHQSLTMHCFLSYFNEQISTEINPRDIVVLGKAFVDRPLHFAGYLFWLLESNADPRDIDETDLVDQFFSYHICELDTIVTTYQYFVNLSERATAFLSYFQSMPCSLRGFDTYNMIGTTLMPNPETRRQLPLNIITVFRTTPPAFFDDTDESIFNITPSKKTLLSQYANLEIHCDALFKIFGWAFIAALDFRTSIIWDETSHNQILITILSSNQAIAFIQAFLDHALSGEITIKKTAYLFQLIGEYFWQGNSQFNSEEKAALLLENPMLIHAIPHFSSPEQFSFAFTTLKNDVRYHSTYHVPLLCALYKKISNNTQIDTKHKTQNITFISDFFNHQTIWINITI